MVEPGEAVHQRRLARARRAHDRGEATGRELDGHAVEGADLVLAAAVHLDGVDDAGGGGDRGRLPAAVEERVERGRTGRYGGGGHGVDLLSGRGGSPPRSASSSPGSSARRLVRDAARDVRLEADRRSSAGPMRAADGIRYVRVVNWLERRLERLRSFNPLAVDGVLAVVFTVVGIVTVFGQDIRDDDGLLGDGFREPARSLVVTALVDVRADRHPPPLALPALVISSLGILVHFLVGWPEGSLPLAALLLTYTVGAWCPLRQAVVGLGGRRRRRSSCSGSPTRPGSTRSARSASSPSSPPRGRSASRMRNRRAAADARGPRGRRARRGRAPERGPGAGRGAAADRPGAARRRRPLDVGHRRAGRRRRPRARRPPEQARAALEAISATLARHAHRDAPAARRAARRRRRPVVRRRPPVSPTCRASSTTCGPPACR